MSSNSKSTKIDQQDSESPWAFYLFMATVGFGIIAALGMLITF